MSDTDADDNCLQMYSIKEYKSLVLCVGFSFENAVDGQLGEF